MRQFLEAKRQYRDAIVFFRMGDFYEMFYEDALVAARALDLALTSRSKDVSGAAIPMCGVPFHAADGYIARLVRKGYRVAICEQVEDPKKAKGLVQRAVVRVVSPGTLTDASYLEAREPAFLLALAPGEPGRDARHVAIGAALIDLSTGDFSAAEYRDEAAHQALAEELTVLRPREVLLPTGIEATALVPGGLPPDTPVTRLDPWVFGLDAAHRALCEQLRTSSLEGFGLERRPLAVVAAGVLVQYLRDTQKADLAHVRSIRSREYSDALVVDAMTLKHLAVVEGADGGRAGSLLAQLDHTQTSMGGRLLRAWLLRPLARLEPLQDRLDAVEELAFRTTDRGKLRDTLKTVHDLERLVSRAALGTAGPRDLVALRQSLAAVPRVRRLLHEFRAPLVRSVLGELDELTELRETLAATLVDEPPALARDGGAIREGVDPELDELRLVSRSGREQIAALEEAERARTGISSLKVRFNRVFGYYIEVSRANLHAVPADYQRKQTIAGGERFITPSLKEFEERVLGADERLLERELEIFEALRARVAAEAPRIQDTARALATFDVLAALAEVATHANYIKPQVHDGDEFVATETRHPIVEQVFREPFVPNDVLLDGKANQLVILTGPNMGGKSTYLRQVALLSLMAQTGSFVPARQAKLPVLDRLFARVGASDNIVRGQSTFMVEMQETARILHSATSRSLVVLDEIGRGTSTYDGISLAWAIVEHVHDRIGCRTLFATHYHELTDLSSSLGGVKNLNVAVKEWEDNIAFLHKIVDGAADKSYGIHVARLAGIPAEVNERAKQILAQLETEHLDDDGRPKIASKRKRRRGGDIQLTLFGPPEHPLLNKIRDLEVDHLAPIQALQLIQQWQRELKPDA
jgi:DNA mismatch repair protein MutS